MTTQVGMNQLLNCFAGSSSPASPTTGQLWYDTGASILKVYNGSGWISSSASSSTFNAIGTYIFAVLDNSTYNGTYFGGATFPATALSPVLVTNDNISYPILDWWTWGYGISGTWQLMGFIRNPASGRPASLFVRIA
jgi:hypothetical protein